VRRQLLALALVAVVAAPSAAAHGGGGAAKGYRSSVVSVEPASTSVRAEVIDADDRLRLVVTGDTVVIVDGYENEPYLRFDQTGVYVNTHSPAGYLNEDRYGKVALPAQADPKLPAAWEKVGPPGQPYDWHDHRIHWMSTSYPPVVAADTSVAHHIFDWKIPGLVDGKPLAIEGSLDYQPLPGQKFPVVLLIPLALLALGGIVLVVMRNRPRRPQLP